MQTNPTPHRAASRSIVVGTRLALALVAVAVGAILLLFFLLDPTQTPAPPAPLPADDAEEPVEASPVEATLVADVTSIRPGETFRAGVLLRMRPGWHVFWKDPGEAGLPTEVELRAPAQFSVSDLGWPIPVRFHQPGDLVGYGYADWVLLASRIDAPAELGAHSEIPLRARVGWLTCERVCEPGDATLELLLPVADAVPQVASEELFASWGRRLPTPADAPDRPLSVSVRHQDDGSGRTRYTVDLDWRIPAQAIAWFPVADSSFELLDAIHRPTTTQLSFVATRLSDTGELPRSLESVLTYTDDSGVRRGVELPLPLLGDP